MHVEVMCEVRYKHLVVNLPNHFLFPPGFKFFFIALHIKLGLSHLLVLGVSRCICNKLLDPMAIHFFHCIHGGERTFSYFSSKYKEYFHCK